MPMAVNILYITYNRLSFHCIEIASVEQLHEYYNVLMHCFRPHAHDVKMAVLGGQLQSSEVINRAI